MQKHIPTAKLQEAISTSGKYLITEAGTPAEHTAHAQDGASADSYFPIILIFSFITGVTLIKQFAPGPFNLMHWMNDFMAGFFLVFSFFKLMNLKGFAEGYRSYDLIAAKIPVYGLIYPFIELGLAIAFITRFQLLAVNIIALVVMAVSSAGVIRSLLNKTRFQCACLGTVIKLPLSKVTLFEDLLMVIMSSVMIFNLL